MPKAIVIGAGFGGIAAALRLRKKGYDVTILDKQQQLGGRGTQYRRETPLGTFIHDAGPTVVTAKFLFDELFDLFGKKREDYIEFRDIFPWYRIVFSGRGTGYQPVSSSQKDGLVAHATNTFDYGGTLAQMEAEIARFEPKDVEGFRRFLVHSKKIFDVGFTKLGAVPFHQPSMMFKCAPDLIRLESYKTVYQLASKYISNESLRRVFSFQPLLVGGNPFNTTSIYSLIFYLEREWGVQFAMGGTGAIVRGLEKLMREEGIEIRLGEEVQEIEINWKGHFPGPEPKHLRRHRLVTAIKLKDGERIPLHYEGHYWNAPWSDGRPLVVANADAPFVWQHLIDKKFHTKKSKWWMPRLKYSMGLFVLYFGTKKTYPEIAHHTIVLGETYRELIDKLFKDRDVETKDLSVYVHRPTATDPSMAPAGCESFYVLVPVPNLQPKRRSSSPRGTGYQPVSSPSKKNGLVAHATEEEEIPLTADGVIDWSKYGDTFLSHVLDYLERTILPGLRETIVDPFYVTPDHFKDNLNSMHGAGFSIQPIFSQSAYFRFHNKAPGIEGLYFVGAGTHPGAGMPGVLCSAKVVESLVPDVR